MSTELSVWTASSWEEAGIPTLVRHVILKDSLYFPALYQQEVVGRNCPNYW